MEMKMSEKKERVLRYLREKGDWAKPTEIGDEAIPHSEFTTGSSVASPVCKALVKEGLLERSERGHYRVKVKRRK
jgi:Fe2+ or Zn2+ uptake regulation protein